MSVRSFLYMLCAVLMIAAPALGKQKKQVLKPVLSEETEECIDCHEDEDPGLVADWLSSRHSKITPAMALKVPGLKKRMSALSVPPELMNVVVGCYECHSLNPKNHKDNFEHKDYYINVVVSPNDCKTCHPEEVEQFSDSKKAHAQENLEKNPVYHLLTETITGVKMLKDGKLERLPTSDTTKNETCYGCHGTVVEVNGMRKIPAEPEPIYVPNLTNWPNQGIGRVNPDGSRGACTACHPRHSFSVEIARKPATCGQCHLGPDAPAYYVYKESKHGNIYDSKGGEWNWDNIPWTVGKDFKAPTCAVCHASLITDTDGLVIADRTHDYGSRLWVRIFGLIYTHPQPKSGATFLIRNNDGLPLPTTYSGVPASEEFLISKTEQDKRKGRMKRVCQACHNANVIDKFFTKLDGTISETDRMTRTATELMEMAWSSGLADRTNPFDEVIEQKWMNQWLIYGNSTRYASAMSGPDYAAFTDGWWQATQNIQEMYEIISRGMKAAEN